MIPRTHAGDEGRRTDQISVQQAISSALTADEAILIEEIGYEACGLVSGASVFHIGLVGYRKGNCELEMLSSALLDAREVAARALKGEATRAGAHGVVALRLTIEALGGKSHLARVVAIGTGIRPRQSKAEPQDCEEIFLSALSGQEFAILLRGSYRPVGLVMGVCVYHVGRQGLFSWAKNQLRTVELPGYTSALYEARELAMRRVQHDAMNAKADGVVGVTTSEQSHVWGSHVIEFFAMGTAVSDTKARVPMKPTFALSVQDSVVLTDPSALLGGARADRKDPT